MVLQLCVFGFYCCWLLEVRATTRVAALWCLYNQNGRSFHSTSSGEKAYSRSLAIFYVLKTIPDVHAVHDTRDVPKVIFSVRIT